VTEESSKPGNTPAQVGRRFGRYLLLDAIDRGGMAEVYRAVSQGPGGFQRQFVIKRIRKEKAASRDFVDMFVNEARISALLEHPNIVQVYDFGQVEGDYYLAMEYLRGRNLLAVGRRLRRNRQAVPADLAAYVGREVARGLHYAHTLSNMGEPLNIIHRDVSPSNIMLLKTGGIKLLDFGIARATMKLRSLTPIGGLIKGKLSYLSPEQVKGGGAIDGRSDIFSLGIVLWEALTGMRLFFHPNDLETMRNVLHRPVPRPSELRPDIPAALDAVVCRALERDPGKRYPDAAAMAAELEEHLREVRFSPEAVVQLIAELFAGEDTDRELPLPAEELPARITATTQAAQGTNGSVTSASQGSLSPLAINITADPTAVDEQGYATESAVHRLAAIATQQRRRRMIQGGAAAGVAVGAALLFAFTRPAPRPPAALTGAVTTPVALPAPPPVVKVIPKVVSPAEAPATDEPAALPAAAPRVAAPAPRSPHEATRTRRAATSISGSGSASNARIKRSLTAGLEALEKGEYIHAAEQLEEVSAASPTSHDVLAALAEAEFELARYSRAVNHAKKAASLAPRNVRYQSLLGDSYYKLGRMREAVAAYAIATSLAPQDQSIRERKARAEALLGASPHEEPRPEGTPPPQE
jgi:serine/threonine protein kinase